LTRLRTFLAALGIGLSATLAARADEPALPPPSPEPGLLGLPETPPAVPGNQDLANAIANRLRQAGTLKNFQIEITVKNGVVEIDGRVASAVQQAEVFNLVATVPGVESVVDRLVVHHGTPVAPAQHTLQPNNPFGEPPILGPAPKQEAGPPLGVPTQPEPTPIFKAMPPPMPGAYQPPKMPPHAWPTYAPYNNFSRVGYPNIYPYQSWPFIGPMYPFPKIPPGWRSVTLTWRDGFWWYGRNSTGYDWWTVKYW
jgi:hypothetical protein